MKIPCRKTDKLGRTQYSKSERRELVHKYQRSGMSQSALCKAYGLIGTTWLHLMRKKKMEQFPVEFAEVEIIVSLHMYLQRARPTAWQKPCKARPPAMRIRV